MKKLFILVFALVAVISMVFAISVSAAEAALISDSSIATSYEPSGAEVAGQGWNGGSYTKHAFDGSYDGLYNNTAGRYIIIDLGAKLEGGYQVTDIKVYHAGNTKYSLYYTTDGLTWKPIVEQTSAGTSTFAVNAVATQVKYVFDTVIGWTQSLQEIEVYGIDPAELSCFHTNLTEEGWVAIEGSATCTTIGNQTQTCPDCGEIFTRESASVPALGHSLTSTVVREGTSTEYGSGTITCERCDYGFTFDGEVIFTSGSNFGYGETANFMSIIVSSIGHQSWGNSADNLTDGAAGVGWMESWYAATNDDENEYVILNFKAAIDFTKLQLKVLNDSKATLRISALNAETGEYEVVKELATYDEALANFAAYDMTVSMLGVTSSSLKIQVISTSVWQNGFHYDCMTIGEIGVYGVAQGCGLKAEEHIHDYSTFVDYKVAPTCTTAGSAIYKCICNEEIVIDVASSEEFHNYDSFTMLWPSCVATGIENFTCTICGDNYTAELPMDPESHNYWVEWETQVIATCIAGGYEKYVCQDCGDSYEVTSEADTEYGHSWTVNEETYIEATCIADGYRERTCSLCYAEEASTLDKTIFGSHNYVADPETYKEANCVDNGYANYVCSTCGDSYEEETPASEWMHDYVGTSNYSYWECSICGDSYFYVGNAMSDDAAGYEVYIYSGNVFNVCTPDYVFDEYYHFTYGEPVDGVYTVTLTAGCDCHEANGDTLGLVGGTCTFTLVENGMIAEVVAADGTTYTFDNVIEIDYNSQLNGTYSFNPEEGVVFTVKFEDGIVYVLEDTMGLGLSESFAYSWNPNTGMLNTDEGYFYVDVTTGDLYYGRGWLLSPVEEGGDEPDPEVNYGDWFTSILVATENSFGFNMLYDHAEHPYYTFVAEEAGAYSFFVPAGLGFWSKTSYDAWVNPEVEFMGNTGSYVTVELEAGAEYVFSVGAETETFWEITVYYLAPEHVCDFVETDRVESTCTTAGYVTYTCSCGETYTNELELAAHAEVEIPVVLPTPSTVGYTAGVKCAVCEEVLTAPAEITVTEMEDTRDPNFRIGAANLSLQDNISVNYWAVVTEGYNNPYMVFVFNGIEYVVTESSGTDASGRLGFNFDQTFPQFMNDNIEAYLYAETAEGQYSMNKILEYSVKTYCINQLKKGDAVLSTVVSDVLTLGAMTQVYVGYNTDALVTDLVAADGYTLTPSTYNGIDSSVNKQAVTGDRGMGTDWKSASLVMGAATQVKLFFLSDDLDNITAKINLAGEDRYFSGDDFLWDATVGRYYIVVDYVKSYQYNETITATFENNDGEQIGSTLTYSINSYLFRNVENTAQSESARNLMKALYVYGVSIYNYSN